MARLTTLVAAVAIGTAVWAVRAADTVTTDWPSYNRTLTSDRYAPLDQINKSNVARLKQLCVFDLDVDVSFQAGPIVIGRYCTSRPTGRRLRSTRSPASRSGGCVKTAHPSALRVNRGAAYLGGRLFRGTGDGDLVAYDAATGARVWKTHLADPDKGESMPAAPVAWNGMVLIGTAGSERYGVTGRVYAVDAATGKPVWETYTVPTDAPQPGNEAMQKQARATWGNAQGVPVTGGGTWTQLHDRSGSRPAVRACRKSRSRFHDSRPARRQPLYELDPRAGRANRRLSQSLLAGARRLPRLGPRGAPVVATTKSGKRVVAGAPKDGLLHVYDLAGNTKLYATPITTRLNDGAAVDDAAPLLPGLLGRHRMERACLQPGHELVLRRNR